jgi:hypothetical protein
MFTPSKTTRFLALLAVLHVAASPAFADGDLGPSSIDIAVSDCARAGGTVEGTRCRLPPGNSDHTCGLGCLILFSFASYALAAYLKQPTPPPAPKRP